MSKEEFEKFLGYVDKISNQVESSINTAKTKEEWRKDYLEKGYKVIKKKYYLS
jgi:hypothetical protein